MLATHQIKPNMPVVCSQDNQFAVVDYLEGMDNIRLKRDSAGTVHYIPVSWVNAIDDKVHIDRPGSEAMKEWRTTL